MHSSLKVCLVIPSFVRLNSKSRGGTETYTEMLARGLLAKGVEVHVLMYSSRVLEDSPPIVPVRLHILVMQGLPYFSNLFPGLTEAWSINRRLLQLDRAEHFDAIEGSNDEGRMFFVARTFGRRFWLRLHSSLRQHITNKKQSRTWSRRFSIWLDGAAARRSQNLITHSRCHAQEMAREYRIPENKIHIVPHAIESPKTALPPAPRPAAAERQTLAYLGTLDQRKGIDVFLKAIPLILAQLPQTRFLIIGRDGGDSPAGSWNKWFAETIANPTLEKQVEFRGFVADDALPAVWEEISLVVVPSRYESFGLVVVEAYLRSLPVLAASGGSLPEVAQDGALLVAADDVNALAAGAIRMLSEPGLAPRLAQRGRQIYQEHYTLERFADAVVSLFTAPQAP